MTPLETKLATALASAVNEQTEKWKQGMDLPDWYQDAFEAMEEFDRQKSLEQNTVPY